MKHPFLSALCFWAVWSTLVLPAQTTQNSAQLKPPPLVRLSGSLGLTGEFLQTTRAKQTAPNLVGRAHSDVTLHVGKVQFQTNLLYSTQQNRFQESLNQVGLRGQWKGLSFSVGDHYPVLSSFSLSGAKVQGASAQLALGGLYLAGVWGTNGVATQKTLTNGTRYEAYTQRIQGVRFGLGKPDANHFHLAAFSANDDTLSVSQRLNTKPQQNLSLSASTAFKLFKGAFQVSAEGTGSAYNPNAYASKLNLDEATASYKIPKSAVDFMTKLFTPTAGTGLSYAVRGDARLQLPFIGLTGSGRYVAPGFNSLGAIGMVSDVFDWSGGANLLLLKGKIVASGSYSRNQNNLSKLLLSTTSRDVIGVNLQIQPIAALGLLGGYQQMNSTTQNELNQSITQRMTAWMLSPTLSLVTKQGRSHTISLSLNLNEFETPNPNAQSGAMQFRNQGGILTVNSSLSKGLVLTGSGTYLQDESGFSNGTTQGLNLGASKSLLNKKLRLNLTGGYDANEVMIVGESAAESNTRYSARLTASYSLTPKDAFQFNALGSLLEVSGNTTSIREMRGTASYTRKF